MGSSFYVSPSFNLGNQLARLVGRYYRSIAGPVIDNTKKAEERKKNMDHGHRQGIAEGIAVILTGERVHEYGSVFDMIQEVSNWDVTKVLEKWHGKIKGSYPDDDETTEIVDELLLLIKGDEEYQRSFEQHRRDLVLNGTIKPTEADRPWLEELKAEQQRKVAALALLIGDEG